ncbi:MAG: protein kinase [Deltaproteobacteria bacterium]|nr:protein kinase [Deltaproteobacteria bacterium]
MRCEICGAPFKEIKDEKTCPRCASSEKLSGNSNAPKSPVDIDKDSRLSNPDVKAKIKKRATIATGYKPVNTLEDRPVNDTGPHDTIPISEDSEKDILTKSDSSGGSGEVSSVVLEGKYRLLTELGRGSMGTVFLAEDTFLKRKVAVKFLLPELSHMLDCSIRFKKEAIAMAAIRNENVAQIYSYGEDRGNPYFVMEYLEGDTIEYLIDAHNRRGFFIPLSDAVDIMIQILMGVSSIHRADAVHRDIKPGNIMLESETLRSVIMDFGLVRNIKVEDDVKTLAGTPAYIAPELIDGTSAASPSHLTDIYSIGATFYELLTGSIPFNGKSWVEILQKHMAEIPEFPSVKRPGLPTVFDDILLKAMSKVPRERYETCDDMLDDILAITEFPEEETRSSLVPQAAVRRRGSTGGYRAVSRGRISSHPTGGFRVTPSHTRGRLLVADSDPEFRTKIHDSAKAAVPSCRIYSATDGIMAMDMIKSVKPHLLIINLKLQEMSGFEIIASLIGDPDFNDMEIIAITENSGTKDANLLKGMGINHFWSKPIDIEAILEVMIPVLEMSMSIKK